MRRIPFSVVTWAIFASAALISPASAEITFAGGDGTTAATAIKVLDAKSELDGVAAEYGWLRANRRPCNSSKQGRIIDGEKYYDLLAVNCNYRHYVVYFDVSEFAGK